MRRIPWALASLSLTMLLSSLGTSIANVALPTFVQVFDTSFQAVQWVVLAYLLAITTLIVSVGRLGDLLGRRRLMLAGVGIFTVASAACGVAPTLWVLVVARAAQGFGAAIMMALTMAFVGDAVPKARAGSAMGLLGTMSAIGTALGPTLGGTLIAGFGWRAIFLINLPLGLLAIALVHRYLPADRVARSGGGTSFDYRLAAARTQSGCVCAGDDGGPRSCRRDERGAAVHRFWRCRAVRFRRKQSPLAAGPVGVVSPSRHQRGIRDERPGHHGGHDDAGGRHAELSTAPSRSRWSTCRRYCAASLAST